MGLGAVRFLIDRGCSLGFKWAYGPDLEGQGDLVSRRITPVSYLITPITIPIINLLPKSPGPSK